LSNENRGKINWKITFQSRIKNADNSRWIHRKGQENVLLNIQEIADAVSI
jgi:Zn-finger protein